MGKSMQPYEAHIPFLLQLKIDLNLAGMGWLHLSQVIIRLRKFARRFYGSDVCLKGMPCWILQLEKNTCTLVLLKLWPLLGLRRLGGQFCNCSLAVQIYCRVPFPERFMHRRRGWRDTPVLIQYEHDAPQGMLPCAIIMVSLYISCPHNQAAAAAAIPIDDIMD